MKQTIAGALAILALVTACFRPANPPGIADATGSVTTVQAPSSLPPAVQTVPILPLGTPPVEYLAWLEEARALYPYPEPVETMWAVMLCESGGQADVVAGGFYGLFQYAPQTWSGDWNPYRHSSILDPYAQILATAKAWADGYQAWWSGCLPNP